ncbi:O-antigen ligase family protein [Agreia sp. Leaf283]|uniref:O-antigen ligase family protein n=1 Tax=Agreia sp. Leaf283 TaxID=1736321 RepID=UPI0012FCE306|nr:O-antigen ligase family protein [Agreia sp. Leaf283]
MTAVIEMPVRQNASLLAGSKLVILGPLIAIAGGRWGSYLGLGGTPVYFADLAVGVGALLLLSASLGERSEAGSESGRVPRSLWFASSCMAVVLVIGLIRTPSLSLFTARDALPFFYLLLIPLFYRAIQTLGRDTSFRWLRNAAIVHLVWFAPAVFKVLPEITIPFFGGTPAFSPRGDFDLMICGLTIVVVAADKKMRTSWRVILVLITLVAAFSNGSRAGLIAAFAVVGVVLIISRPFSDPARGLLRFGLSALAVVPLTAIIILLVVDPPEWAVAVQKLLPSDSSVYQSGQNTWNARISAWQLIANYASADGGAVSFGFGFGSFPIRDSGAVQYLSGDVAVRAAHNFLVTWFAFTGLVGVGFVVLALVAWAVATVPAAFSMRGTNAIGLGLVVGVLVAAVAGVILESPFGYMTFALAIAFAAQRQELSSGEAPGNLKDFSTSLPSPRRER